MVYEENIKKINPLKRDQVLSCIKIAQRSSKIAKLIIFGSAVTNQCKDSSDVDICIDVNGPTRGKEIYELSRDICWACDHNCDILTYGKLNREFKNEVDSKGVIVYELS